MAKKIISCFTLFNEIDLLRLRLSYEYYCYDYFVIVEATKTFAGKCKILYFEKYKYLFKDYLDKIIYLVVDDMPEVIHKSYIGSNGKIAPEYRWHLEAHQRNSILRGLQQIELRENDLVLINDLDELVDITLVDRLKEQIKDGEIHYLNLKDYRYSVSRPPEGYIPPSYLTFYKHLKQVNGNIHFFRFEAYQAFKRKGFSALVDSPRKFDILRYLKKINSKSLIKIIVANLKWYLKPILKPILFQFKYHLKDCVDFLDSQSIKEKLFIQSVPAKEILKLSDIKRAYLHNDAGWHFSHMTGGYKEFLVLKAQNFAHSEWSEGLELDSTKDYYKLISDFIRSNIDNSMYILDELDSSLPAFIKENIHNYCILLLPKDQNVI